jgi:hypothetical protein
MIVNSKTLAGVIIVIFILSATIACKIENINPFMPSATKNAAVEKSSFMPTSTQNATSQKSPFMSSSMQNAAPQKNPFMPSSTHNATVK